MNLFRSIKVIFQFIANFFTKSHAEELPQIIEPVGNEIHEDLPLQLASPQIEEAPPEQIEIPVVEEPVYVENVSEQIPEPTPEIIEEISAKEEVVAEETPKIEEPKQELPEIPVVEDQIIEEPTQEEPVKSSGGFFSMFGFGSSQESQIGLDSAGVVINNRLNMNMRQGSNFY